MSPIISQLRTFVGNGIERNNKAFDRLNTPEFRVAAKQKVSTDLRLIGNLGKGTLQTTHDILGTVLEAVKQFESNSQGGKIEAVAQTVGKVAERLTTDGLNSAASWLTEAYRGGEKLRKIVLGKEQVKLSHDPIVIEKNTGVVTVGASSLTVGNGKGGVDKLPFSPQGLNDYENGIVSAALGEGNKLSRTGTNILHIPLPGMVLEGGKFTVLTANFGAVRNDIQTNHPALMDQYGFINLKRRLENAFKKAGYLVIVNIHNDTVPALSEVMTARKNANPIFQPMKGKEYVVGYVINGSGTGQSYEDLETQSPISEERGHIPLDTQRSQFAEHNPVIKHLADKEAIQQECTIEQLVSGGPSGGELKAFSKITNIILERITDGDESLSKLLGFDNVGLAQTSLKELNLKDNRIASLENIGKASRDNQLANSIKQVFAKLLGSSIAHMHYYEGVIPPVPVYGGKVSEMTPEAGMRNASAISKSAVYALRDDGSTTKLLENPELWKLMNESAQNYAKAYGNIGDADFFEIVRFRDLSSKHPDFGTLPELATEQQKRTEQQTA